MGRVVPRVRSSTSSQVFSSPWLKGLFLRGPVGGHPPPLPPTSRPYVHVRFRARSGCFLQASAGHCVTYLELGKDQVGVGIR